MAELKASRVGQNLMCAEFIWNYTDTMKNISGVLADFKSVATPAFDVINLPPGSKVVGGAIDVITAYATSTVATVTVGDDADADRYSNSTTVNLLASARTALTPTVFENAAGKNVRITFNITVAASTAGKCRLQVWYTIDGRANEVVPA